MSRTSNALRAWAVAGFGLWSASVPGATEPAQIPLVSRVASPPPPDVMITIDDSGSMQAHFMPEGSTTVHGARVAMPEMRSMGDLIDVFRGDQQRRTYTGIRIPRGVSPAVPGGPLLFQRHMRSSDVNSIFYNPAVLYLPWLTPDGVTRMVPGVYAAALWNPADPSRGSVDLRGAWNAANGQSVPLWIDTAWCPDADPGHCDGAATRRLYDPGLYYVLQPGADPRQIGSFTEFDLNDNVRSRSYPAAIARVCTPAAGSGCCAASGCTLDQERQNFANWFVYYRTRTHMVQAALSETLSAMVGTPGNFKLRVGWGTINTANQWIDGARTDIVRAGVRNLDAAELRTLLSGIQQIDPYGGTPLRRATASVGGYFRRDALSDAGSPWREVPGAAGDARTPLPCRRAFNLLTTDGYYNDDPAGFGHAGAAFPDLAAGGGNVDGHAGPTYGAAGVAGSDGSNPQGSAPTGYRPVLPYADAQIDMLADYAMAYYIEDLQPRLDNRVPADPGRGDIAYWQHLSMFTVGLGVTGPLDPATSLPGLSAGTRHWTDDRIDDLWHAALDTQGEFFSASDVVQLEAGLNAALGSAAASSRSESGAATSSAALDTSTFKVVPSYSAGIWTGSLKAYPIDGQGRAAATPLWDAARRVPDAAQRRIFTWTGPSSTPADSPVPFDTTLPADLKRQLSDEPARQDALIRYLRGDPAQEGPAPGFRKRQGRLGDFTDSPPTFVRDLVDLHYDTLAQAPGYRGYFQGVKAVRREGVIFEGANDGMLHAFAAASGDELYAYVPRAVLPRLPLLASQGYGSPSLFHRNYVDGPQTETDAFIPTRRRGTAWANLLVGSYGAGAPGLYALDLTALDTFDDRTLLWELDGGPGGDPDVGHIQSRPVVGVLPAQGAVGALTNGAWEAFVGNGAYSANGRAVLLIVNLASGRIDARVVLPTAAGNGLMGVQAIRNENQEVVGVVAGDLQGHVWRIDFIGDKAPSVGFGGQPLFRAVDAAGRPQPVTAPPAIYPRLSGRMVVFGTGRLIDGTDADDLSPQSVYGVWDPTPEGATATDRSLFSDSQVGGQPRRLVVEQTLASLPGGYYSVSDHEVDFQSRFGWYMDLPVVNPKQRVIYAPLILGQWVLINTMAPGGAPAPQSCEQSIGTSAYFLVSAASGSGPTTSPVWDVNGDGRFDGGDQLVQDGHVAQAAGYATGASGGDTGVLGTGADTGMNLTTRAGDDKRYRTPCIGECAFLRRVWRQLLTPPV